MIKFALSIKLQYMLRKVFFFLFLIVFSVNGNLIGDDINTCPIASDDGNILDEGGITNGNVLSNDIDSDGDFDAFVGSYSQGSRDKDDLSSSNQQN